MNRILLTIVLVLLLSLAANAQDEDTVEIQLSGAYYVTVPESWEVDRTTGEGYFWNSADSLIRIRTYSPFYLGLYDMATGVMGALESLVVDAYGQREFDEDALEEISIGDYEAVSYSFEQNEEGQRFNRTIIMYEDEVGFLVTGNIRPQGEGEINPDDMDALLAALETVRLGDTFKIYEGTSLEIPEGWTITEDYNAVFAHFHAKKDGVELQLVLYPGYGVIAGFERPIDFLPWAFRVEDYGEIEAFQTDKLQDTTIAGFDAAIYEFEPETLNANGTYARALMSFDISNNSNFLVYVVSENPDDDIEIVFEVLDTLDPGRTFVCALFADPGIRIRSEPDTNSELVRQTNDETLIAFSTSEDAAGNTWFNIGEGYIRSDVIFYEQNPCDDLPEN